MSTTESQASDVRLRIFAYHLAIIAKLDAGQIAELHPIAGLMVRVKRTDEGFYNLNGERTCNLYGAFGIFAKLVNDKATGLHADND